MKNKENFAKDINVPSKEQIMVDGVNIIDCDNYYVKQETDQVKCDLSGEYCRENKNCFYKQLARNIQECEELKKQLIQKDKVGTNDIEKSLLYIWSECVLEIVSVKQYKEIKKLFDEKIKQTITGSN